MRVTIQLMNNMYGYTQNATKNETTYSNERKSKNGVPTPIFAKSETENDEKGDTYNATTTKASESAR